MLVPREQLARGPHSVVVLCAVGDEPESQQPLVLKVTRLTAAATAAADQTVCRCLTCACPPNLRFPPNLRCPPNLHCPPTGKAASSLSLGLRLTLTLTLTRSRRRQRACLPDPARRSACCARQASQSVSQSLPHS